MYRLLSHNDLDGVGCGILAKLAFKDEVDVRYNSVSKLNYEVSAFLEEEDNQSIHLFITDLSVNEENEKKLEEFYKAGGKVQLIDHHKTALHLNEHEWGYVKVEDDGKLTCATSLLYDYFVRKELLSKTQVLDEFVELVRQYDTWEWEKNNNFEAKRLNALFFLLSIDEFEEKMLKRLRTDEGFFFEPFEEKLLDMEDTRTAQYIRRKRRQVIQANVGDHVAGVVFAENYLSELGNELGKEYPHLDYIAMLNMATRRISFRTIHDDVDVSEVASKYGGGGHVKASGCIINLEAFQQYVVDTFEIAPLKEDARYNEHNVKKSPFGTMYRDRDQHTYFIKTDGNKWLIKKDNVKLETTFTNFSEAERYLKRNHAAWLVTDHVFVSYLMGIVKEKN